MCYNSENTPLCIGPVKLYSYLFILTKSALEESESWSESWSTGRVVLGLMVVDRVLLHQMSLQFMGVAQFEFNFVCVHLWLAVTLYPATIFILNEPSQIQEIRI